eukprot:5697270-Pleurochrysis_carterae.AAC.1
MLSYAWWLVASVSGTTWRRGLLRHYGHLCLFKRTTISHPRTTAALWQTASRVRKHNSNKNTKTVAPSHTCPSLLNT